MKTLGIVLVSLMAVALQTGTPAGTWRAEFQGPRGTTGVEVLTLTVKGDVVTGTFQTATGAERPVRDGTWDGRTLRFWVPWDRSDKLEASGTLSAKTLTLLLKATQWQATRVFQKQ